jgi:hypothetical protein
VRKSCNEDRWNTSQFLGRIEAINERFYRRIGLVSAHFGFQEITKTWAV